MNDLKSLFDFVAVVAKHDPAMVAKIAARYDRRIYPRKEKKS